MVNPYISPQFHLAAAATAATTATVRRKRDDLSGAGTTDRLGQSGESATAIYSEAEVAIFDTVHPAVPGPRELCRQPWSSFLLEQPQRDRVRLLSLSSPIRFFFQKYLIALLGLLARPCTTDWSATICV